jgi:hypothetical protein
MLSNSFLPKSALPLEGHSHVEDAGRVISRLSEAADSADIFQTATTAKSSTKQPPMAGRSKK